jgi:hypothetical protein
MLFGNQKEYAVDIPCDQQVSCASADLLQLHFLLVLLLVLLLLLWHFVFCPC